MNTTMQAEMTINCLYNGDCGEEAFAVPKQYVGLEKFLFLLGQGLTRWFASSTQGRRRSSPAFEIWTYSSKSSGWPTR